MKKLLIILSTILILPLIIISCRGSNDIQKKLNYAIQNVQTSKDIRVHNADYHDNAKTILHLNLYFKQCLTMQGANIRIKK